MTEIWKDIVGYEGLYQVSNVGRVKSLNRTTITSTGGKREWKECVLKPLISNSKKYCHVSLYKNNRQKLMSIHRLVAIQFIPNPENKNEVNHIDGNISNNTIYNLEWRTRSENQLHAYAIGLQKPNFKKSLEIASERRKRKINKLDMNGNYIQTYQSIVEASLDNNVHGANIRKVAMGVRKHTGGFKWEYLSE